MDGTLSEPAIKRLKELIVPYSTMTFDEMENTGEDTVCKSNEIIEILKSENLM